MTAYYNEFDPFAAAWLRELIKENLIAPGDVDERSIKEVQPEDLRGYTQCHFFGGIGGWSLALRLAGWSDDTPVWTGSAPCQPFSAAGKQKAQADDRHLWPDFFRLIKECRPDTVFGEQVEGAIRHGWLDGIQADLEREAYAVGHCVLGAHSVGAPHIRQRLFWVADADRERHDGKHALLREEERGRFSRNIPEAAGRSENGRLAEPNGRIASDGGVQRSGQHGLQPEVQGAAIGLADTEYTERRPEHEVDGEAYGRHRLGWSGAVGGMGDADEPGPQGRCVSECECPSERTARATGGDVDFWRNAIGIPCRDGKTRRIEPGIQPLAHGLPARTLRLRGYGNAIVPQVAATFIQAYLECRA